MNFSALLAIWISLGNGVAGDREKVAVDLRATVPKATPTDRRPEVDGYLPR